MNRINNTNNINEQETQNINLDQILFESINEYKYSLISSVFMFMTGIILSHIVFPKSFSLLIDNITTNKSNTIGYIDILTTLIPYIASEVLIYFADILDTYYLPKIEFLVIQKISDQVLESVKINNTHVNTTELVLNLKKVFDLRSIYHLTLVYIIPMLLLSITLAVYFWYANKKLGIFSTILLLMTFIILVHLSFDCTQKSIISEQNITSYCDDINDIFINIDNVISAGENKNEVKRIITNGSLLHDDFVNKESCNSNLKFTTAMMYFGVMIGLNGMSTKLFYENAFDKTQLMTIFFMVLNLVQHCDSMIYEMHNITHAVGNYKEIKKYFEQFKLKNNKNNKNIKQFTSGNIIFQNITIYNGDKLILNDVNCEIKESQKTALIGNIGTGKTTLIKALMGLLKYKGSIKINNVNINELGNEFISKNIAYIPQNPRLFNRTILENLKYGTNYSKEQIIHLLKQYKMINFFEQFENGVEFNVGTNGDKLSGGQRQLVFILRSIIQNKKIFVLDEPTSALDENHKNILFKLLDTQNDKTIIIITHDKEIFKFFDNILLLENNKIKKII